MADVFLSYARADRDSAARLAEKLEAEGLSVWWDRHITGGAEFSADIERELAASKVVVVAWSAAARDSHWVKDEAAVGRDDGKLVPVNLDGGLPPLGFRQYHAIDFANWDGSAESSEIRNLIEAVGARMRGEGPAPLTAQTAEPRRGQADNGQAVAAGHQRQSWPWLLGGVILIAGAALGYQALRETADSSGSTFDRSAEYSSPDAADAGGAPRVAVADFRVRGDLGLETTAAALGEDVANGLSRFPHLRVASRSTADATAGTEAAYRLEGSLRRAGATLRLTVQLLKTANGEQVWGESYDRSYDPDELLAIQDDLTANVVASVADSYGALMRDLAAPVAVKAPGDMTPYEAMLRYLVYRQRLGDQDHRVALAAVERALQLAPNDANLWAAMAALCEDEYKHSYNIRPGSLDRALDAARRAVALEPDNAYANFVLAEVFYFRQDLGAFRATAEKAIALNPYDSDAMAMIGILTAYGGDWDRGVELTIRAMGLNPNHPGWYRFGIVFDQLRRGDYPAALDTALRINLPMYFADPYVRAVAHAYLGNDRQAEQAAQEFLALWPDGDLEHFRSVHLDRWFYAAPELVRLTLEGLERAGLEFD